MSISVNRWSGYAYVHLDLVSDCLGGSLTTERLMRIETWLLSIRQRNRHKVLSNKDQGTDSQKRCLHGFGLHKALRMRTTQRLLRPPEPQSPRDKPPFIYPAIDLVG